MCSDVCVGRFFGRERLLRETDAADDFLEARVGAKRVEPWAEKDAGVEAFVESFLEPKHGLIEIAESSVDGGDFGAVGIGCVGVGF
jgi:hypothetical protein